MRLALATAFVAALTGCAYPLQVLPRDGSPAGIGAANSGGKTVVIAMDGKTYRGTYVHDGGAVIPVNSFGTATAFGRAGATTVTGSSSSLGYVPGSGNGRLIAMADGDTLRCEFTYISGSGLGACQDNAGKAYDLVIGSAGAR